MICAFTLFTGVDSLKKKKQQITHKPQTTHIDKTNISLFLLIPLPKHQAQERAFPGLKLQDQILQLQQFQKFKEIIAQRSKKYPCP